MVTGPHGPSGAFRTFHRSPTRDLLLLATGFGLLFYCFRGRVLLGDAAIYSLSIAQSHFFERSVHFGYYVVGWLAMRGLGRLGIAPDDSLVILNGVLMVIALLLTYLLARRMGHSHVTGLLTASIFGLTGNAITQGTSAEIYALEMCFVLASYNLFLAGRAVWAGIAFGAALLVTPLALFGSPFFLWGAVRGKPISRALATLAVAAAPLAALLVVSRHEYFYGTRGLLSTAGYQGYSPLIVAYNGLALFKNLHWLLPFLVLGSFAEWRSRSRVLGLMVALLIVHAPVLLGMKEDGVFLFVLYPFLSLLAARGLLMIWQERPSVLMRSASVAAVVLFAVTTCALWLDEPDATYRARLKGFISTAKPRALVLAAWHQYAALRLYSWIGGRSDLDLVCTDNMPFVAIKAVVDNHATAYAVEKYYPNRVARLAPRAIARTRFERNALAPVLERAAPGLHPVALLPLDNRPTFYVLNPTPASPAAGILARGQ